jgi:manganese/iron transport system permease protein
MDLSIFGYSFMQNAILAAVLGGVACATVGVFVVLMGMSFIGVCLAHAAFAGAVFGVLMGFNPLLGAFIFSLATAAIIGPLASKGELNLDTSIGVLFSLMLGLAFLFIGLMAIKSNPLSDVYSLLWGSILTVSRTDVILLGIVAVIVVGLVILFYKEIRAVVFNRDIALAVGIPSGLIVYGILFLTGSTITVSLSPIGGLLIYPAAAAYQLTYNLKMMFLLSALFALVSGLIGLLVSYLFNVPTGATIVVTSSLIFGLAVLFSPKRKIKRWQVTSEPSRVL